MLKKLGLVMVALVMVLAACGDDSGGGALSAEEQAKAVEIAAELTADTTAENPFGDPAAATCFSEGIVSSFGITRINELDSGTGVEAGFANMTAAEQETVAELAMSCIDFGTMIKDQMAASGLPEAQANCVAEGLNNDLLKALFLAQIRGEDPTQNAELMSVVMGCLTG
jgi:hypothetical protein